MSEKQPLILVVEDDFTLAAAIQARLTYLGLGFRYVVGGQSGLEYLQNSGEKPDAIWLDFYLNDMDGMTFMKRLDKIEAAKGIPVIVVSNSSNPTHMVEMKKYGAKEYFIKSDSSLEEMSDKLLEYVKKPE